METLFSLFPITLDNHSLTSIPGDNNNKKWSNGIQYWILDHIQTGKCKLMFYFFYSLFYFADFFILMFQPNFIWIHSLIVLLIIGWVNFNSQYQPNTDILVAEYICQYILNDNNNEVNKIFNDK